VIKVLSTVFTKLISQPDWKKIAAFWQNNAEKLLAHQSSPVMAQEFHSRNHFIYPLVVNS